MNHKIKLHPDGTLEITMPKGKKASRVLVCEAGTQNATLYYPEGKKAENECVVVGQDEFLEWLVGEEE